MHWIITIIALAIGLWFGWWFSRRRQRQAIGEQRQQQAGMLELLDDLESWTHRYAGDVSQHQHLLDALSEAVSGSDSQTPSGERVLALLQQVVQSNNDLKQKLATAESQLDQKSRQIKCYLTEARTDALTGLANRRALDQQLEEMFAAYRRGGRSFVVALIDVDHFKSINDAHGHAAGDRVLKQFASQLQHHLSDALLVARYGGEEFAAIMDGPLRSAAEQIDQLREQLAARKQRLDDNEVPMTISAGLSVPLDDIGAASIVRRADEALYAAKHIGRNRVYYHDGSEPTLVGAPETARS